MNFLAYKRNLDGLKWPFDPLELKNLSKAFDRYHFRLCISDRMLIHAWRMLYVNNHESLRRHHIHLILDLLESLVGLL